MKTADITGTLAQCIAFHGHFCPGLAIGYRAAETGMEKLGTGRSEDEEFIAIVENDTCAVDAIQVMTGCTFGKGNLFFRDWGKMVFTLARRQDRRYVRLSLRPIAPRNCEDVPEARQREQRIADVLEAASDALFDIQTGTLEELPSPAVIRESVPCAKCGETAMSTRVREVKGETLCIPCAAAENA